MLWLRHAWVVFHCLCWCVFRWCCDLALWAFHDIGVGVAIGNLVCVFMCAFLLLLCILSAVAVVRRLSWVPTLELVLRFYLCLLQRCFHWLFCRLLPVRLHLSTAALSSSVLLVVAVAGLLLLLSLLDMGDPLPLPWPLEALAAGSARLKMLSCRVWQCPVERQPSGGLRGLAL